MPSAHRPPLPFPAPPPPDLQLVDAGVEYVVCFETPAHDEAALWLGVGLARALAQGHGPRAAFEAALAAVRAITTPDGDGGGFVPKFELASPAAGAVDKRGRLGPEAGEAAGRIAAGVPVLLCRPALVAGVPSVDAAHHIPRPEDVSEVLRLLSGGSRAALVTSSQSKQVGLPGMPGLGKTRLAACVARDPRLHGMCPDGAVMHSAGEEASAEDAIAALTRTLADALRVRLENTPLSGVAAWKEELQRLLRRKRMLVVIDDAWGDRQVYPIVDAVRGSEGGSLVLLTSRRRDVLGNLGTSLHQLGLLPEEESLTLMGSWAQPSWTAEQLRADEDAMAVARLCGAGRADGLPLALSSVGALVRSGRTWGAVLRWLSDARKEVEVGPDYHPEYGEEYRTVYAVLRMGIEALPDVKKERYMRLAVFAEDEAIGEEVLMVLWQLESVDEVRDTLVLFHERSLLASLTTRCSQFVARLHDLQREVLPGSDDPRVAGWHAEVLRRCGSTQIGVYCGAPARVAACRDWPADGPHDARPRRLPAARVSARRDRPADGPQDAQPQRLLGAHVAARRDRPAHGPRDARPQRLPASRSSTSPAARSSRRCQLRSAS